MMYKSSFGSVSKESRALVLMLALAEILARSGERIGCPGEHLDARAAADTLKRQIADTMRAHGAANLQLGKFYDYRAGRDPAALAVLDAVKNQLDPKGLMNPGVLSR